MAMVCAVAASAAARAADSEPLTWPPKLPNGAGVLTFQSEQLLQSTKTLRQGVAIAKTPPVVDFLFYDCQKYPGKPWSNWGDGLAVDGKYYSAIGDHKSPEGNAFVYEYDVKTKTLRSVVDLRRVLKRPKGHYTPGKIHSRIDRGSDGWLYFSTHRGSTRVAFDPQAHFKGDWILRHHPQTGRTEIVAAQPLPMQCLPASVLDPDRLIFYAGTADGRRKDPPKFLAYDVKNGKVLHTGPKGFARYAIFARSTGRLYFHAGKPDKNAGVSARTLVRFDPKRPDRVTPIDASLGLRAATVETSQRRVYTIDGDRFWSFDTRRETARSLGPAAVGVSTYTTSLDVDEKTGRYLYYVPGAHGGAERDGSPLVQYDLKMNRRKVIAFLHPVLKKRAGFVPIGTFSTAVSPAGDMVFITWNGCRTGPDPKRGRYPFESCAMTVVHIPESERRP
ncbi:MAG: hypothetical protein R3236_09935 [Phycisphaeraceae bacterium]|nr:hypothetical protein [Phycisphaeraceae bacterium]